MRAALGGRLLLKDSRHSIVQYQPLISQINVAPRAPSGLDNGAIMVLL
jgi:hypothetical protein